MVAPATIAAVATRVVFRNCRRASMGPLLVMVVLRQGISRWVCDVASRCSMRTPNNLLVNKWLASDADHKHSRLNGGACDRSGEVCRKDVAARSSDGAVESSPAKRG